MTNIKKYISDDVKISESISATTESMYLIISNKEKCKNLLSKDKMTEEEMIDFYISLHIVMEASLNALFRNLSLIQIQKGIDKLKIAENIDRINFTDKTTLFIYNQRYNFKGEIEKADKYHNKIIGGLRNFCEARNRLLHGHSISTLHENDSSQNNSRTRELLKNNKIEIQIKLFKDIFEGLQFYVTHIDSSLTDSGITTFKGEYLDDSFLY